MTPCFVDDPNHSLQACVASLFEKSFSFVPFIDMTKESPTWMQQLNEWTQKKYGCKWVAALYMVDEFGNPQPEKLWVPPGWYIEAAETEDGTKTVFQVCCGGVVMHRPTDLSPAKIISKLRMWLVVVDPGLAFPI